MHETNWKIMNAISQPSPTAMSAGKLYKSNWGIVCAYPCAVVLLVSNTSKKIFVAAQAAICQK